MGLGLAVGMQHAFEPDHIAAVSTQISTSKFVKKSSKQLVKESMTRSSMLGVLWGAGHTTTIVLVAFLAYVLSISILTEVFSGLEFGVGIMLVVLGITAIWKKKIRFRHKHPHTHKDGSIHFDEHDHVNSEHSHTHKSYFIGMVHGLAGSGSVVVLTAVTLDNVGIVFGFVAIFGIGSIIGMALVGSLLGIPLVFGNRIKIIQKSFRYVTGGLSLIIGFNIMYHIITANYFFGF